MANTFPSHCIGDDQVIPGSYEYHDAGWTSLVSDQSSLDLGFEVNLLFAQNWQHYPPAPRQERAVVNCTLPTSRPFYADSWQSMHQTWSSTQVQDRVSSQIGHMHALRLQRLSRHIEDGRYLRIDCGETSHLDGGLKQGQLTYRAGKNASQEEVVQRGQAQGPWGPQATVFIAMPSTRNS